MDSMPKFIIEASQHCPLVANEGSIFKVLVDGIHKEGNSLDDTPARVYYGFKRTNSKWIFLGKALTP